MKSFSSSVKEYLCEKSLEELVARERAKGKWKECCRRAFLRSVFLTLAKEGENEDTVSSDREAFLEVIAFLLIRSFDLEAAVSPRKVGNRKGAVLTLPKGTRKRILAETANDMATGCDRCRVLFICAAFLSHGTILDPEKGYHAAFLVPGEAECKELAQVLEESGVYPGIIPDPKGFLLYLKESSKIEDLLSVLGAHRFALDLMNRRIDKSLRGNINRRLNFDGANMKKTVNSAQSIISAIHFLEETDVLSTLSESLQKAAKLRLSYPEVSLAELVRYSEEEITKSGLNHRLQKLCAIAEKKKNKEDET